ncbi:cystathionine gamma-synthase family protein [uncultured Roseivirga sp.]|uniref:cystathionine gamma-synthase family protein n=1 Tax=uncultured Roseivirga sp. TaxID=543088 RepID=UPI0030DB9173|tara:strand:+ start:51483 stop:52736 length:1254 start_codon:yes stop_codon:yes gene_type:complete
MKNPQLHPESLMMSYGYKPELSEGSLKCPIFQTSTFVFKTAEEGKAFFEVAYGLREKGETEELGLIYSRLNNPDLEILENRLTLWDKAEDCAVFESGMSAITTVLMEFLSPGDVLLYSQPVYGGTSHFIEQIITRFGINVISFDAKDSEQDLINRIEKSGFGNKVHMVYIETPANPTNQLIDMVMCKRLANRYSTEERQTLVAVDNTYMGPLWQHPLKHGADLVLYSATKYIGGHSDVIAGACLGSKELMGRVKGMRTFLGNMAGPWTGWLLMRSLETLKARMNIQEKNAQNVAEFLINHPKVGEVFYLGNIKDENQQRIFNQQCEGTGAMVSFEIKGDKTEASAFKFLNNLKLMKLAVSLGSTESLAEHPASMTHAGVSPEDREKYGISPQLIRLSIGVEHQDDIIWDIEQALEKL